MDKTNRARGSESKGFSPMPPLLVTFRALTSDSIRI